jgi:hypothetical protein
MRGTTVQTQPYNPTATITFASPTTSTSLAEAPLAYAQLGWPVFPLASRNKVPLKGTHGYKDATTDAAIIEQWWQQTPDANIGLATTTLAVLDIDPRNGGHLALADLEAQHGPLPSTVESQTGSGGRHVFFQAPNVPIRKGAHALGPGLDIKSGGPHVALPPSIHPSGRAYEWELSSVPREVDVAPMPEWMVELLTTPRTPRRQNTKEVLPWGEDVERVTSSSKRSDLDLALARLLGIDRPVGANFLCLLHPENRPSAWLFWGKGGDLLYHCEHFGGYTLTLPAVRASVQQGRIVRLKGGGEHFLHRFVPLYAAGLIGLPPMLHMPLPEDAPPAAKTWYAGFLFTLALKSSRETAFSRRFAVAMTGLSESDEQAAAKWLLRHGYVQTAGQYKAYGKDCNLLSPGPGPAIDEAEVFGLLEEEEAIDAKAA